MRVSELVKVGGAGAPNPQAIKDAINTVKAELANVYTTKALARLSHDSPFLALGLSEGAWESFPGTWRKRVRKLWRQMCSSRKELANVSDRVASELDDFLAAVQKVKIEESDEDE